jgi:hypothetical protein
MSFSSAEVLLALAKARPICERAAGGQRQSQADRDTTLGAWRVAQGAPCGRAGRRAACRPVIEAAHCPASAATLPLPGPARHPITGVLSQMLLRRRPLPGALLPPLLLRSSPGAALASLWASRESSSRCRLSASLRCFSSRGFFSCSTSAAGGSLHACTSPLLPRKWASKRVALPVKTWPQPACVHRIWGFLPAESLSA